MAPHGSLYLQVHGIGSLLVSSFPELEKQGGNLTVESILRGIRFAAKQRKVTSFSTIYLQLDNTGSNKCVVVIDACCLLVKLGVAKNMKINFLEVGHTHKDIDALIGSPYIRV